MRREQSSAITIYSFQQKLFWMLISCIVLVAALYFYVVGKTILNVVGRSAAEAQITNINSDISDLEARYIALGQSVNADLAVNEGFQNISKIEYVSRSNVLTMRDDAR